MDESFLYNIFVSTQQLVSVKLIRNRATGQSEGALKPGQLGRMCGVGGCRVHGMLAAAPLQPPQGASAGHPTRPPSAFR